MRARVFIVFEVGSEDSAQTAFIEHDDVIQTLAANRADQSLDVRVLPRRLRRGEHLSDAEPGCRLRELLAVAPVTVPQHVMWRAIPRKRFEQLVSDPFRRRMLGHRDVHGPATIVRQNHEDEQDPEEDRPDDEKVGRNQGLGVVSEERPPRLRRWPPRPDRILCNRRFCDLESELQEFAMDAWRAPARVGYAHSANQVNDFLRDGRPALRMAALPAPVEPEASSVPRNHRLGFDDY